jgi:hypothetical protein
MDMDDKDSLEETEEKVAIQKPKRTLNEKQMETVKANLAKGRAIRDEKRQVRKEADLVKQEADLIKQEQHKARLEDIVTKKATRLASAQAKKENKLKQLIGEGLSEDDNDDVEIEERIFKKPKKKKIIYREESDSEEEVVISRKKRPEVLLPPPPQPVAAPVPLPKRPTIMFY